MGVQSTRYITREDAERMWVQQYITRNQERLIREAKTFTDEQLEDELESTFDNYMITEDTEQ